MNKKTYFLTFFFFLLDFISKILVKYFMDLHDSIKIINKFFYITYVQNTGAAFSMFQDSQILLLIVSVIMLFILYKYLSKNKIVGLEKISYCLLLGGILGNLFDRIVYGYVIDYFDFYIFGYNYPIFNVADCFIVIGILLIIFDGIRKDIKCKKLK